MKISRACFAALLASASFVYAQAPKAPPKSPAATESWTAGGKTVSITYSAPNVNGREGKLFTKDGKISTDRTYPVWRAGANSATKFHTDADLDIGGLAVPAGDYTLFVDIENPAQWNFVLNKQTGQWGLTYDKAQDLGRAKMKMAKPAAMVEALKYSLKETGAKKATLTLEWENVSASVPVTVK